MTLPLAAPGLAITTTVCLFLAWNDFFNALALTRSRAQIAAVAIVNLMNHEGLE